jgi:hypothetical protein
MYCLLQVENKHEPAIRNTPCRHVRASRGTACIEKRKAERDKSRKSLVSIAQKENASRMPHELFVPVLVVDHSTS